MCSLNKLYEVDTLIIYNNNNNYGPAIRIEKPASDKLQ